jgi:hypothetical protein
LRFPARAGQLSQLPGGGGGRRPRVGPATLLLQFRRLRLTVARTGPARSTWPTPGSPGPTPAPRPLPVAARSKPDCHAAPSCGISPGRDMNRSMTSMLARYRAARMCLLWAAALQAAPSRCLRNVSGASIQASPTRKRQNRARESGAGAMTESDLEPGRRCSRIADYGRLQRACGCAGLAHRIAGSGRGGSGQPAVAVLFWPIRCRFLVCVKITRPHSPGGSEPASEANRFAGRAGRSGCRFTTG